MIVGKGEAASSRLEGVKVLVVEDESIISFLIEDMLAQLGCSAIWHASGVGEALALLDERQPDAAVLDVNLGGEPADPVAARMASTGIPFVFATGYGQQGVPIAWADRPVIQKPFKLATLASALRDLLGR
jgi:CheY-like chemotaxis protein